MSVVVWVRGVGIGCDSEQTWHVRTQARTKVIHIDERRALGICGTGALRTYFERRRVEDLARLSGMDLAYACLDRMQAWIKDGGHGTPEDDGVNSANVAMLLAERDRCWTIDGCGSVDEVQESYAAIGSGASVAYGALHLGHEVGTRGGLGLTPDWWLMRALYACADHAHGCGGPVQMWSLQ